MNAATAEPDDPGASLAGEYVLGLLEGEERARFERRLAADATLRREVVEWERRLAPIAESIDEVAPPPDVWPRIERSLRDALRPAWGSVDGRRGDRRRGGGRRAAGGASVALWRAWALGATAAAAALAGLLVLRPEPPAAPRLVAVLSDAQARPAYVVTTTPGAERLSARPVTQLQPGGRVYELWLLPGADAGQAGVPAGPVSLGLLDPSVGAGRGLPPAATRLLTAGRGIAVSLEPPGGSPTGAPTGPVVYTGVLLPDADAPAPPPPPPGRS